MNKTRLVSTFKFIGAAVIVIAAGLIMFPALISFGLGIARLVLWVVVVLLAAYVIRRVWNTVRNSLKKPLVVILVVLQLGYCSAKAQGPGADRSIIVPAGTTFEGRIDTRIGSSISQSGQRFHIVIASPVLANGTTVLIPAGTRVLGEVVEAIPASHVYHEKGTVKPKGKLRIQLTALEMPNGAIFPMVASLIGESFGTGFSRSDNPNLGRGVGYVGSSAGFNAVTPQSTYVQSGRTLKPQLVSRDQMLHDPLYGVSQPQANAGYGGRPVYRSLRQHGNNVEIENDSPLSVKLDAALRIPLEVITQSVHSGKGMPSALGLERDDTETKHGKHHNKPAPESGQPANASFPSGESAGAPSGAAMPMPAPPAPAPARTAAPTDTGGDAGF